jgi:hypothetical protein
LESTVSQQLFPTRPPRLTLSPVERLHHLLEEIELADQVGPDVFGIGEQQPVSVLFYDK